MLKALASIAFVLVALVVGFLGYVWVTLCRGGTPFVDWTEQ